MGETGDRLPEISPHLPPLRITSEGAAPKPVKSPGRKKSSSEVRAADRDREDVVASLRDASADGYLELEEFEQRVGLAYGAETRADLDALVQDLPRPVPEYVSKRRPVTKTVSVLSSNKRIGPWRPDRTSKVLAVFGSCVLDLSDVDERYLFDLELRIKAVFGGVEVMVPEGVDVELEGFSFLGSRHAKIHQASLRDASPVVRVVAHAWCGGVNARTRRRRVP